MNFSDQLQAFLQFNIEQISRNLDNISENSEQLCVSYNSEKFMIELANKMAKICEQEPSLLKLNPPITIIGDLHGHILNLYQILKTFDMPPNTKYLFLGDIVDRGPFSIEVTALVFALKICYPEFVYIIRGNHEFSSVSLTGGFYEEVSTLYKSKNIFDAINNAFEYLPIAALIGTHYLCVHGGISPDLKFLSQLGSFERPIIEYTDSILCGLFWSDPHNSVTKFQSSGRGVGFLFGQKPLEKFLTRNNLKLLIRGHECVDGYSFTFDQKCITVFSASNYCGKSENHSAVLRIMDDSTVMPILMKYLKYIQRSSTTTRQQIRPILTEVRRFSSINIPYPIPLVQTQKSSINSSRTFDTGNSDPNESISPIAKKANLKTTISLNSKLSRSKNILLTDTDSIAMNENGHPINRSVSIITPHTNLQAASRTLLARSQIKINPVKRWRNSVTVMSTNRFPNFSDDSLQQSSANDDS